MVDKCLRGILKMDRASERSTFEGYLFNTLPPLPSSYFVFHLRPAD